MAFRVRKMHTVCIPLFKELTTIYQAILEKTTHGMHTRYVVLSFAIRLIFSKLRNLPSPSIPMEKGKAFILQSF